MDHPGMYTYMKVRSYVHREGITVCVPLWMIHESNFLDIYMDDCSQHHLMTSTSLLLICVTVILTNRCVIVWSY